MDGEIENLSGLIAFVLFVFFVIQSFCVLCASIPLRFVFPKTKTPGLQSLAF